MQKLAMNCSPTRFLWCAPLACVSRTSNPDKHARDGTRFNNRRRDFHLSAIAFGHNLAVLADELAVCVVARVCFAETAFGAVSSVNVSALARTSLRAASAAMTACT